MARIPNALKQARVYQNGAALLGQSSVSLPDVSHMTETYEGMGTGGQVELPMPGETESLEAEFAFSSRLPGTYNLLDAGTTAELDVRFSQQVYDPTSGRMEEQPGQAFLKGFITAMEEPDVERGSTDGPTFTMSVLYYRLTLDGEMLLEIDKANMVHRVRNAAGDLVDLLEQTRANLGM